MVHFYRIYHIKFIEFTVSIFIYRTVFIEPRYINFYLSIKTIRAVYQLVQELGGGGGGSGVGLGVRYGLLNVT